MGRHRDGKDHRSSWLRSHVSGFAGPAGLFVMSFEKSVVWVAVMLCSKLPHRLALEIEDMEQYLKSAADVVVASWNASEVASLDWNLNLMDHDFAAYEVNVVEAVVDDMEAGVHSRPLAEDHSCCSNFQLQRHLVALMGFVGRYC